MSGGGASNYTPPAQSTPWIYKTDIAGGSTGTGGSDTAAQWLNMYGRGLGVNSVNTPSQAPTSANLQGFADGGLLQNPMSNYATSAQNFMQYPQQGQLNQPPQPQLTSTQYNGGPDGGADYAPSNMGFDTSGSDGGVGGQPAPMQTPLGSPPSGMTSGLPQAQGNKPLGLAQFQQPQGLQIQGNPTSQVVQRPQQR